MKPAGDGTILLIWYIFCCLYGIFWLRRYYLDKKDTFGKYIISDLTSHGLKLETSRFISNKTPKPVSGYKTAIHPASGGSRIASFEGYKIFRSVTVTDQLGIQHELLAAIEFDDRSLFRRFKSVGWTPELNIFLQEQNAGKANRESIGKSCI